MHGIEKDVLNFTSKGELYNRLHFVSLKGYWYLLSRWIWSYV